MHRLADRMPSLAGGCSSENVTMMDVKEKECATGHGRVGSCERSMRDMHMQGIRWLRYLDCACAIHRSFSACNPVFLTRTQLTLVPSHRNRTTTREHTINTQPIHAASSYVCRRRWIATCRSQPRITFHVHFHMVAQRPARTARNVDACRARRA